MLSPRYLHFYGVVALYFHTTQLLSHFEDLANQCWNISYWLRVYYCHRWQSAQIWFMWHAQLACLFVVYTRSIFLVNRTYSCVFVSALNAFVAHVLWFHCHNPGAPTPVPTGSRSIAGLRFIAVFLNLY